MKFDEEWLENVQKLSFKNIHAKGLDYLCIGRTPEKYEMVGSIIETQRVTGE